MNELKIKENKILELTGENKLLKEKVKKYKREIEMLELEKKELVRKYRKQNDELCQLKIDLSKGGYYDNKGSK